MVQVPETLAYLNSLSTLHFLEGTYTPPNLPKGIQVPPIPSDKVTPDAAALIKQPLASLAIVEWLQIGDLLPPGKDFEPSAGNYAGIVEKNVKTPLRGTNDPRLPSAWDLQINAESVAVSAANSKQKTEDFQSERLPELIFGKIKDTAAVGQPNRAATEMMKLIRSYPTNPSVPTWIDTARKLLTPSHRSVTGTNSNATETGGPDPLPAPSPTPSASVVTTPQPSTTNN